MKFLLNRKLLVNMEMKIHNVLHNGHLRNRTIARCIEVAVHWENRGKIWHLCFRGCNIHRVAAFHFLLVAAKKMLSI